MTIDELRARIEILERRQRRGRVAFLVVILLGCGALLMAQTDQSIEIRQGLRPLEGVPYVEPTIQAEVRTNALSLYDRAGRQRGVLSALGDGSVLALFDGNGKTRAELSAAGANVSFTLYDPDGKVRTVVGSTGLVGSRLRGERAPASSIIFMDREGNLLSRMP